jgi:hypothetical protein
MLPEETHERLRRLAHRRGLPLAQVIRQALSDAVRSAPEARLSFVGAVDVETGFEAEQTAMGAPPISSPVTHATAAELETLRRQADEQARRRGAAL